jgi:hypothetical protein
VAERVQIDLVVNTTQLDVAEARRDAFYASQAGAGPSASVGSPGAVSTGAAASITYSMQQSALNTALAGINQRLKDAQLAGGSKALITAEQATMLGWAHNASNSGLALGFDPINGRMFNRSPPIGYGEGARGIVPDSIINDSQSSGLVLASDPTAQKQFGRSLLAHQYYVSTGRHAPDTMSASEIYRQTQQFEAEKAALLKAVSAQGGAGAAAAGSAAASSASRGAKAFAKKAAGRIIKMPGKTGYGAAATIAFAALDGMIDEGMDDYDFRRAAGIDENDPTWLGGSASKGAYEGAMFVSNFAFGVTAKAVAMSPGAMIFSKDSWQKRMHNVEENLKLGGPAAVIAEKIGYTNHGISANYKAQISLQRSKASLIKQNEWNETVNAGMKEIERNADNSAADFAHRVYGGGELSRGEVAALFKQSVIDYQKRKFLDEAWEHHPDSRIAKDPPKKN